MNVAFYLAGTVAVLATSLMVTRANVVHALLYLVVSLLAVALVLFTLGAPFVAALEVVVYAGAILVLFVFVVMMLDLGAPGAAQERRWLTPGIWTGPVALAAALFAEVIWTVVRSPPAQAAGVTPVGPAAVGAALYGPYLLTVELASLLLLAAVVGVHHLGSRARPREKGGAAWLRSP
jgi:NADH-quinone oxidoreductase subunit J